MCGRSCAPKLAAKACISLMLRSISASSTSIDGVSMTTDGDKIG
jgi:hypothetical protein